MKSKLLGREMIEYPYRLFTDERVVVTGGRGSIGRALVRSGLPPQGGVWSSLDLNLSGHGIYDALDCDILDYDSLYSSLQGHHATMVVHAAAHKHAAHGETDPGPVADLNVRGTENVVNAALALGIPKLVFLSTCKAVQPETAYGASKLVGERIVLNAGYTVARLYNVVESSNNVFAIWDEAHRKGAPIRVANCQRRFIHMGETVSFILSCLQRHPGRFVPLSQLHDMEDIAMAWVREHPGARIENMARRRGDRKIEPRWGEHEQGFGSVQHPYAYQVVSPHDA